MKGHHAKAACPVTVVASTLLLLCLPPAQAQTKSLIPIPRIQFLSTSGTPLANGHVHTYISLTTTAQATYTDSGGGTPNANPVLLDGGGFASIWLTPGESYTIALHDSSDAQQWSVDGVTSGTLDTNLVVGTTAVTFTSTPTFNSATSVYFSITLSGNVASSTLSNAIDGRIIYFNICQDATGGRTFTWAASVLNAPTVGTTASSCTSASFIFDGTNWRELAASSRGSVLFDPYVDLAEQGSAPDDPAATIGRLYVLTADDILRIKRGATVVALVDDTNAQTIAGVKTFSAIPVLPASNPTTDNQAARKAYVDSTIPLTTKGDVLLHDGTSSVRLAVGTNNQVLTADSAQASGVKWAAAAGGLGYVLQGSAGSLNPLDGTTYFWGSRFATAPTTVASQTRIYIPLTGNITLFRLAISVLGTLGSAGTVQHFLRLNDTTDELQLNLSYTATINTGTTAGSVAVVEGDFIDIKFITPTWVTNPTSVVFAAVILIE